MDLVLDLSIRGSEVLSQLTRTDGGETAGATAVEKRTLFGLAARARPLLAANESSRLDALGQRLFGAVLPAASGELWLRSYAQAAALSRPIRLRVRVSQAAELQLVPWEILHDGTRSLARDRRSSVVRFVEEEIPFRTFSVPAPARVLLTTACPQGYDEIDVALEEAMLREAYATWGALAAPLVIRHGVSLTALGELFRRARLDGRPFHVWHHCGHGGFPVKDEADDFRLFLLPGGTEGYATVGQLTTLLQNEVDLRIAVLAVCHAGAAEGLAPALARLNVPAVVGFPTRIAHRAASTFSRVLHECLREYPVEQAVSEARNALRAHQPHTPHAAVPVLFSRRTDSAPLISRPVVRPSREGPEALMVAGFRRTDLIERDRRAREAAARAEQLLLRQGER